jgi:hypothetical protein
MCFRSFFGDTISHHLNSKTRNALPHHHHMTAVECSAKNRASKHFRGSPFPGLISDALINHHHHCDAAVGGGGGGSGLVFLPPWGKSPDGCGAAASRIHSSAQRYSRCSGWMPRQKKNDSPPVGPGGTRSGTKHCRQPILVQSARSLYVAILRDSCSAELRSSPLNCNAARSTTELGADGFCRSFCSALSNLPRLT